MKYIIVVACDYGEQQWFYWTPNLQLNFKWARAKVDLTNLPANPCLKKKNFDYHFNDRDQIQRTYLQKRLCQPTDNDLPKTQLWKNMSSF
jgi:hypothetical protein